MTKTFLNSPSFFILLDTMKKIFYNKDVVFHLHIRGASMKRLFTIIIIITSFTLSILPVNASAESSNIWPKGPKVNAKAAIVMEASTGLILYEKNIHDKNYPASTTKLMTTLLALENSSLNEKVVFSRDSVFNIERGSSHIGIDVGEVLSMEHALYGIMLASANEVSYAVGEHIAGDIDSFSNLMNERAKELGARNTHFINPHGLYDEEHYTSAYDLALISKELLKYPAFREINATINYVIPPTNIQVQSRPISNHHKMIRNTSYHYDGVIGGKTGYTQKARYNLATFAARDGMELICIIMNEDAMQDQYTDTKNLLDFGFDNYSAYKISESVEESLTDASPLFSQFNCLFDKENTPLKICNKGMVILPKSADLSSTNKVIDYYKDPLLVGDNNVIGRISYYYDNKSVGYTNIIYNDVQTPSLKKASIIYEDGLTILEKVEESASSYWFIGISIIFIILATIYYVLVERPRKKRRISYNLRRKRNLDTINRDILDL